MPPIRPFFIILFWLNSMVLCGQELAQKSLSTKAYPPVIRTSIFVGTAQYQSTATPFGNNNKKYGEGHIVGVDIMRRVGTSFLMGFTLSSSWAKADYSGSELYLSAERKLHVLAPRISFHLFSKGSASLDLNAAAGIGVFRARSQFGKVKYFDQGSARTWMLGLEYCLPRILFASPYVRFQYTQSVITKAIWQCSNCPVSSGENLQANFNESQINIGLGIHF